MPPAGEPLEERVRVWRQGWIEESRPSGQAHLTEADHKRLEELFLNSPEKLGYETPLWTCARVAHLIEQEFGIRYHRGHVWKVLDDLGWSCQRPIGRARERNEKEIWHWKRVRWPDIKKKPKGRAHHRLHRRKRDKPGPHRCGRGRGGGKRRFCPYNFNWDTLSAVAGITFYDFYFRLYQGSVKSAEVVEFLAALLRHVRGPLLIAWDRLSAHRSRFTRDFIARQKGRLWVEYLPGYAPELNPAEYIWAYWKRHEPPNVCSPDSWSLNVTARRTLKRMRRRPRLITAF